MSCKKEWIIPCIQPLCCYIDNYAFSFQKRDVETGNPLEGATFTLTKNNRQIAEATSDVNGKVIFRNIPAGTYTMQEKIPPVGFENNPTQYTVIVISQKYVSIDGTFIKEFFVNNTPINPTLYRITYDPNGMTGNTPYIIETEQGTHHILLENMFQTENPFIEWNTEADGSGLHYNPGDSFIVTNDITLYAIWKSRTPTIFNVHQNDSLLVGTGIPGSTITITFPNGVISTVIVGADGNWFAVVPSSAFPLLAYSIIEVTQTEPGFQPSDTVSTTVLPLTN